MYNKLKKLLCFSLVIISFFSTIAYSDKKINLIVKNLGNNTQENDLHVLAQNSSESISLLISELKLINEKEINPTEFMKKNHSLHIIWCIRALRYVTGQDFKAPTQYSFNENESNKNRKYWLTIKDNQEMPFFSVWMSRDIIYIAPKDVQVIIIEKWKEWVKNNNKPIKSNTDIDFWFF